MKYLLKDRYLHNKEFVQPKMSLNNFLSGKREGGDDRERVVRVGRSAGMHI
jgi:hypothetical protein